YGYNYFLWITWTGAYSSNNEGLEKDCHWIYYPYIDRLYSHYKNLSWSAFPNRCNCWRPIRFVIRFNIYRCLPAYSNSTATGHAKIRIKRSKRNIHRRHVDKTSLLLT